MKAVAISIGVLVLVAACGGPREPASAEASPGPLLLVVAEAEQPARLRLCVQVPGEAAAPLALELASAFAPCVSHDAARLCFLGRETPASPVALYVSGIDGTEVARVATAAVDAESAPAWLPDGRVVYAAGAPDGSRALFVVAPERRAARRITFCGTHAGEPTVLADGRILYVGLSFERAAEGTPALLTVHPDGSGVSLLHGLTRARRYARPRQADDGTIAFVAVNETARIHLLDWRAPHEVGDVLSLPVGTTAIEPGESGTWTLLQQPPDASPASVAYLGKNRTVYVPGSPACDGVVGLARAGTRPRPQGHLSMVREEVRHGALLCIDAHAAGRPGLDTTGSRTARLHVRAATGADDDWRRLGDVDLAADGSFHVRVPPDVPLRLELLDEDGRTVSGSKTPFWVRPSEVRGCIGCHFPPDATPPNRMPQAALTDPLDYSAALGPRAQGKKGAAR